MTFDASTEIAVSQGQSSSQELNLYTVIVELNIRQVPVESLRSTHSTLSPGWQSRQRGRVYFKQSEPSQYPIWARSRHLSSQAARARSSAESLSSPMSMSTVARDTHANRSSFILSHLS
jgi:hypothetical protein